MHPTTQSHMFQSLILEPLQLQILFARKKICDAENSTLVPPGQSIDSAGHREGQGQQAAPPRGDAEVLSSSSSSSSSAAAANISQEVELNSICREVNADGSPRGSPGASSKAGQKSGPKVKGQVERGSELQVPSSRTAQMPNPAMVALFVFFFATFIAWPAPSGQLGGVT